MPATDPSSNARADEPEVTTDRLTGAGGKLRRGGDAPTRKLTRLVEIAVPPGSRAPGAARSIVDRCLTGLVTRPVIHDAELLVSELVTNSLEHAELRDGDSVLVSVYLATDRLRVEIQNPGTAGVVAASRAGDESGHGGFGLGLVDLLAARWGVVRNRDTSVWFEMARV